MMSLTHRIGKDTILVTIVGVIAKITPLLSTITIAAFFGTGRSLDAYYLSIVLPILLAGLVGMAINSVFIPVLVEEEEKDRATYNALLNSLFSYIIIITALISLLYCLLSPFVIGQLARALDLGSRRLAIKISMELSPIILFIAVRAFLASIYNVRKRFLNPTYAIAITPISIIVFVFLFYDKIEIHSLILGNVVGHFLEAAFLFLGLFGENIHLSFTTHYDPRLKNVLRLSTPQILSASVLKLNPLVDRTMASVLPLGSISSLGYAERINTVPMQIMNLGFMNVALTHWSIANVKGAIASVRKSLKDIQTLMVISVSPIIIFLWLFRREIIRLMLERGALNALSSDTIASLFGIYLFQSLPLLLTLVYVRIILILKDTKFLMYSGFLNAISNFFLNYIFAFSLNLGLNGIALSTVFTSWIVFFFFLHKLKKQLGEMPIDVPLKESGVALLASAFLGYASKFIWESGHGYYSDWTLMALCFVFFCCSYALLLYAARLEPYFKIRNFLLRVV